MKFKFLALQVFLMVSFGYFGQQNLTMYNMSSLQQTQAHVNPAFTPSAKINIAITPLLPPFPFPSLYLNFSNSGFKLADLVTQDAQNKTYFDFDNMLGKLKKNNYITSSVQIDLVTFGFKVKKNYFSFNFGEKIENRFRYPKDFLNVLINGNGANGIIGEEQKFNFGLDFKHYTDMSIGYSRELMDKKLTVGAKFKYLMGHENVFTKTSDISLTTGTQNFDLTTKVNIAIYTSGLDTNSRANNNFSASNYLFNTKNSGFGFDFGGNYKINEKWSASASLLDIGFINWKEANINYISKNPDNTVTFSGVSLKDFINDSSNVQEAFQQTLDSIYDQFELVESNSSYKTWLNTKFYLSGNYHINEKNFAGLLIYGQFYDKKVHPAVSLSYNTAIGRWLNASINYSILNRSYNNVGFGLSLNPGWFQWYIVSDNVLGLMVFDKYNSTIVPAYTKNLNIRVGFNLTIGKKIKDKDKDGVADKKDLCPDIAGIVVLNGCPDKDGDGIKDSEDKCPEIAGLKAMQGCPDQDLDGVIDNDDKCPIEKGLVDLNGCPDKDGDKIADKDDECIDEVGTVEFFGCPDKDGDKTPDKYDVCPDVAGPKESKGCPDKDGDTVLDKDDNCADVFGAADNKGCPWPDTDNDGVFDKDDNCPTVAGLKELKGCAPEPVLKNEEQKILDKAFASLEFASGNDVIKPKSLASLKELAVLMVQHSSTWMLKISGHTDNQGDAAKNLALSEKRSKAIKKYLVSKGVNANDVIVEWFGQTMPIADNATELGRQKNRRVEMKIQYKK